GSNNEDAGFYVTRLVRCFGQRGCATSGYVILRHEYFHNAGTSTNVRCDTACIPRICLRLDRKKPPASTKMTGMPVNRLPGRVRSLPGMGICFLRFPTSLSKTSKCVTGTCRWVCSGLY